MAAKGLSILLLADNRAGGAATMADHIAAFERYSRHNVMVYNPCGMPRSRWLDVGAFDVVVIHYSITITGEWYLPTWLQEQIAAFDGLKILFLQDEYRWVDQVAATIRQLGIGVLFSVAPHDAQRLLYPDRLPDVDIVDTLTGFVPENLVGRKTPATLVRPIDVGYRGRVLPYWLGALAQEKVEIGRGFLARAKGTQLATNIAWGESDRIYGERWIRFLSRCRATLGTPSGASIIDYDGAAETAVRAYLADHPDASFAAVSAAVAHHFESPHPVAAISPRVFEAAALRTALILFPGEYSGVVRPWEHYLPLERDFSNFDAIVDGLANGPMLEDMIARTHADLIASGDYSLRRFLADFDDEVQSRAQKRRASTRVATTMGLAKLERPLRTGVVARRDLRAARAAVTRARLTAQLAVGDPGLRRIVATYVHDPEARAEVPWRRLTRDLVRLGLLRLAHRRDRRIAIPFGIRVRTSVTGGVATLESYRRDALVAPPPPMGRIEPRTTVLWDHRAVGLEVFYRLTSGRWFAVPVGYAGEQGMHHFGAIERLLELHPELAREIQCAWARPGRRRHLRRVVLRVLPREAARLVLPRPRRVRGRRHRLALLFAPRNYAAKLYLAGRILVERPRLAALVKTWWRAPELRSTASITAIVEDVVKLHALHEGLRGRLPGVAGVTVERIGDRLRFTSSTSATSAPVVESVPPTTIAWDHSPVGIAVHLPVAWYRGLRLSFAPSGTHSFPALAAIAAYDPYVVAEAVWDNALSPRERLRLDPANYAAKGARFGRAVLKSPYRRAVVRWCKLSEDVRAPFRALAEEIIELELLDRAVAGRVTEIPGVRLTVEGETLVARSTTARTAPSRLPLGREQSIRWDNRAVGARIPQPNVLDRDHVIAIGSDGVQTYTVVPRLLADADRPITLGGAAREGGI